MIFVPIMLLKKFNGTLCVFTTQRQNLYMNFVVSHSTQAQAKAIAGIT